MGVFSITSGCRGQLAYGWEGSRLLPWGALTPLGAVVSLVLLTLAPSHPWPEQ